MRPRTASRLLPLALLPLLLAACGGGAGEPPVTLYVTTLLDSGPGSLRQVVVDAPPGAHVLFDPAIVGGTVTLLSPIGLWQPVLIDGGPPGSETTLDGQGLSSHFFVEDVDDVRIQSMILRNGATDDHGGSLLLVSSRVRLDRVAILDGYAVGSGGGVYAADSDLEMVDCQVQGCIAEASGGGLFAARGSTRILHSSVIWCFAGGGPGGGLLLAGGDHVVRSSTIHLNITSHFGADTDRGGGIAAGSAALTGPVHLGVYGCTITGNQADTEGGGISLFGQVPGNVLECRQTVLADNQAPSDPDLFAGPQFTVTSAWNVVGILAGGPIWNGLDGNAVGDPFTPLDPVLGPISGAGMQTRWRTPLPGSPAIDEVPHAESLAEGGVPLLLDQHFASRTADVAADVGAVEVP